MRKYLALGGMTLGLLAASTPAYATSFTLTTGCTANADPGLVIFCVVSNPGPYSFDLNSVGATYTTSFARVGTAEGAANWDDFINQDVVSALFSFTAPLGGGPNTDFGTTGTILPFVPVGHLTWGPPIVAAFVGKTIQIDLGDALFGVPGEGIINVTYKCLSGCTDVEVDPLAAAVPEPGSMLLLGTGLLGLATVARRRVAKRT